MKTMLRRFGGVIMALVEVLVGILLVINPVGFTMGIVIGVGALLMVLGGFFTIAYFRADPVQAAREQNLTKGLCALLAGAFCMFRSGWFLAALPMLILFYGLGILLTGIAKVQWAVDAFRMKRDRWQFRACVAAVTLVVAAVVLLNPFETAAVLWTFTGISLIVEAVLDLLILILAGNLSAEKDMEESDAD